MKNLNNQRASIKFSQNFTVNDSLISDLIKQSSINPEDLVYEIGPGTGVITLELARASGRVVAIEIDNSDRVHCYPRVDCGACGYDGSHYIKLTLSDEEIGGSVFAFALASSRHEMQYSRLFRS